MTVQELFLFRIELKFFHGVLVLSDMFLYNLSIVRFRNKSSKIALVFFVRANVLISTGGVQH